MNTTPSTLQDDISLTPASSWASYLLEAGVWKSIASLGCAIFSSWVAWHLFGEAFLSLLRNPHLTQLGLMALGAWSAAQLFLGLMDNSPSFSNKLVRRGLWEALKFTLLLAMAVPSVDVGGTGPVGAWAWVLLELWG